MEMRRCRVLTSSMAPKKKEHRRKSGMLKTESRLSRCGLAGNKKTSAGRLGEKSPQWTTDRANKVEHQPGWERGRDRERRGRRANHRARTRSATATTPSSASTSMVFLHVPFHARLDLHMQRQRKAVLRELEMTKHHMVPYQMRASGPSIDLSLGKRTLGGGAEARPAVLTPRHGSVRTTWKTQPRLPETASNTTRVARACRATSRCGVPRQSLGAATANSLMTPDGRYIACLSETARRRNPPPPLHSK